MPLAFRVVAAGEGKGRTIALHPQEALLQRARIFQQSEAFAEYRQRRQAAEHRLARLVQLGVRQSRYFGRVKTRFQLLMAATVANLTLVATKTGMMSSTPSSSHDRSGQPAEGSDTVTARPVFSAFSGIILCLGPAIRFPRPCHVTKRAFQPGF